MAVDVQPPQGAMQGGRPVGDGGAQRLGAPHAEEQLVPSVVVDDQGAVAPELPAQVGDHLTGQEGEISGQHGDHVGAHLPQPGAQRRHRTACGGFLPHHDDAGRHGLRWPDHDPRAGVGHGVEHRIEHRAAPDLELGLVRPTQPLRPASGQHDGGVRRQLVHAQHRRPGQVGTVGPVGRVTSRTPVLRIRGPQHTTRPDTVAAEEPLEIRLGGTALAVTMRTPGDDFDLVHGFLATEGVIAGPDDVAGLRYCDSVDAEGRNTYNVVDVDLAPGVPIPDTGLERNFYTSSSCGVCGKASIDAIRTKTAYDVAADGVGLPLEVLLALPDRLRAAQQVFDKTGGLHAAGLFTADGELLALREDVGRHNAVDKVIGDGVRGARLPLAGHVLMVSGRASFELTQKAAMAGIPVLAAVSAPSSLAVELAREVGITLVGFLRGDGCNVYTHPERIVLPD